MNLYLNDQRIFHGGRCRQNGKYVILTLIHYYNKSLLSTIVFGCRHHLALRNVTSNNNPTRRVHPRERKRKTKREQEKACASGHANTRLIWRQPAYAAERLASAASVSSVWITKPDARNSFMDSILNTHVVGLYSACSLRA